MKIRYTDEAVAGARGERWSKTRGLLAAVNTGDGRVETIPPGGVGSNEDVTVGTFVESARELIFDNSGDYPVFHLVNYFIDPDPARLTIRIGFQLLMEYDSDEERDENIVYVLGLAVAQDVPVYPNRDDDVPMLTRYFRELHTFGLVAPDGPGKKVRLKLTRSPGEKITTFGYLEELKLTDAHSPAELALIREAVRTELRKRDEATRVLDSLRFAITELQNLLALPKRNEHALQRWLTTNPILFGPEYERVIPKHRLGAEFEMDYALIRVSGLIDVVEIESSSLRLFKRNGDPTAHLTHAEQQVLNWLEWIEQHEAYARERLPNIMRPTGYVIIGRDKDLDESAKNRLRLRNALFGGSLQILTYDELMKRAINLLRLLEGQRSTASPPSG